MDPTQTVMLLTEREWDVLAEICYCWRLDGGVTRAMQLPEHDELAARVIYAVESPPQDPRIVTR